MGGGDSTTARERRRQEALANRNRQIQNKAESEDESEKILQLCSLKPSTNQDTLPQERTKAAQELLWIEAEEENERMKSKEMLAEFLAVQKVTEDSGTGDAFDPLSVDDTDDLDDPLEYAAWKLRELSRIQRSLFPITSIEEDQGEDEQLAQEALKKYRFLQKYYHKGAFYTDDPLLRKRDFTEAVERDRIDRDTLPGVLQVRDFGKRGKSKWTHLTNEDTTSFDYGWGAKNNYDERVVSRMAGSRSSNNKKDV